MKLSIRERVKETAIDWLVSGYEIDMTAIKAAMSKAGFKCRILSYIGDSTRQIRVDSNSFYIDDTDEQYFGYEEKFIEWANDHWVWPGRFQIYANQTIDPLFLELEENGSLSIQRDQGHDIPH